MDSPTTATPHLEAGARRDKPTESAPWRRNMEVRIDREALETRAEDDDRLPIALSSEHPVRRWDWREAEYIEEVLDHSPAAIDLSRAERGLPFFKDHDSRTQVGLIEDLTVGADRILRGRVRFGAHPDAGWIRSDMEAGIRPHISVGYLPDMDNSSRTKAEGDALATVRIHRWTPLEGSSVPIPADPTVGVGRSLDRGDAPTHTPAPPATPAPRAEETHMENPTRSAAPAEDLGATPDTRAQAAEIAQLCNDHGFGDRAAGYIEQGKSPDQVARELLAAVAARSAPPTPPAHEERDLEAPAVIPERHRDEPGLAFGRALHYLARAKGDANRAESLARKAKDQLGIRAMAAGDEVAGGFLVHEEVGSEVIELLRPRSVVRSLNPLVVPMASGTMRLSKLAGGAAAGYIGENQPAAKTQPTGGEVVLEAKKLAALVPVSNDLLRRASYAADQIIRDDAVQAIAERSDLSFIRGAGSQATPKGLRYQALTAQVLTMTASPDLAKVTKDLHLMVQTLEDGNVRMIRPGWIMEPRTKHYLMSLRDGNGNFAFRDEMLTGVLLGYPFRTTTQIPRNLGGGTETELYFADFADVVIGDTMELLVSLSTEASYKDENGNTHSAFQQDQTVLRVISEHDLQMRHDESVVVLDGVTWSIA